MEDAAGPRLHGKDLTTVADFTDDLARTPRVSLVTLKDHLVRSLRQDLPRFIDQEVAMHEITFHQEEVKENIRSMFGK